MKRAVIRTPSANAASIATALRPDNTDEMVTQITDDAIVTTIERDTTGGLRSTADDYVVNLAVATRIIESIHDTTHSP